MVSLGANVATLVAAGVGYRSFVLASTSQATTFVSNAARGCTQQATEFSTKAFTKYSHLTNSYRRKGANILYIITDKYYFLLYTINNMS